MADRWACSRPMGASSSNQISRVFPIQREPKNSGIICFIVIFESPDDAVRLEITLAVCASGGCPDLCQPGCEAPCLKAASAYSLWAWWRGRAVSLAWLSFFRSRPRDPLIERDCKFLMRATIASGFRVFGNPSRESAALGGISSILTVPGLPLKRKAAVRRRTGL